MTQDTQNWPWQLASESLPLLHDYTQGVMLQSNHVLVEDTSNRFVVGYYLKYSDEMEGEWYEAGRDHYRIYNVLNWTYIHPKRGSGDE